METDKKACAKCARCLAVCPSGARQFTGRFFKFIEWDGYEGLWFTKGIKAIPLVNKQLQPTMEITRIESIADFNDLLGTETLHPLISIIDSSKLNKPTFEGLFSFDSISLL